MITETKYQEDIDLIIKELAHNEDTLLDIEDKDGDVEYHVMLFLPETVNSGIEFIHIAGMCRLHIESDKPVTIIHKAGLIYTISGKTRYLRKLSEANGEKVKDLLNYLIEEFRKELGCDS